MVKAEAIQDFTLEKFDELKNIQRKWQKQDGKIFTGDIFECTEDMATYLAGGNSKNAVVINILEVIPEKKVELKEDEIANEVTIKAKELKDEKVVDKKPTRKRRTIKK